MWLANLVRAHVLGHSSAAMSLREWDLARVISLKKFEVLQQKQMSLLLKANRISERIERGGMFTWYYRCQLNRLNKEFSQINNKLIKYHERAIQAQSHIESDIDHSNIDVQVQCVSGLSPALTEFDYTNAPQCLAQVSLMLNKPPIFTHKQTLHTTADMASELMHRLDDAAQSRYMLVKTTQNAGISEDHCRQANEIAVSLQSSMHLHLLSMQNLVENIEKLTSHYDVQQNRQFEFDLVKNIKLSLEQFLALYGQEDKNYVDQRDHQLQELAKTSVEHPAVTSSINMLLDSEKESITHISYILDRIELKLLYAKDLPSTSSSQQEI